MEIDFQRSVLESYRPEFDAVATQEETMESIVPDASPDVSRIICASGNCVIDMKQVGPGCAKVIGNVQVSVLYLPDDSQSARSIAVSLPFACSFDHPNIRESTQIHAAVQSVAAEARLLNPRKLFVKAEIRIHLCGYSFEKREVCLDLAQQTDPSVQRLLTEHNFYLISAVADKAFSFSELLRQTSTKPSMEDILSYQLLPGPIESKHISNKLVCKGSLLLNVLYRNSNELLPAQFELPFSQIVDVPGTAEASDPQTSIYVKNLECRLQDGELEVSVEAVLQAALRNKCTIQIVKDLYSTSVPMDIERTPISWCVLDEAGIKKASARIFFESGIPAKHVIRCTATPGHLVSKRAEQKMEYQSDTKIDILYLSEDDGLCFLSGILPVSFELDVPVECSSRCSLLSAEATALPVTGGFEVRLESEVSWRQSREETVFFVSAVHENQSAATSGPKPSIVIRRVGKTECLWDIAKACCSTVQDICAVNNLDSEAACSGSILMIPTKR